MGPDGNWQLSPAYDVIYAHNPAGRWTSQHQMSINGKRDDFTRQDLLAVADAISLSRAQTIIDDVTSAVESWPEFAATAGVPDRLAQEIASQQRLLA
jgi:serine/threonine-protein kinase HipA